MRTREFLLNGGWADVNTQNTHITPSLVDLAFKVLHTFVNDFNVFLKAKNIPPVELGNPCGSTTYYKRDLVQNPEREYGDIDVNLFIPRIEGMTNNANASLIQNEVKEFCESSPTFQTSNGVNIIVKINNDYVQVDFIMAFMENREWTTALAPEYNVKGVLCNSLYSSLGEALQISMGGAHGVQAKTQNGQLVPFKTVKDVVLTTITNNPKMWALDVARYFGAKKISQRLKAFPGMIGEIRVADIVNSIRGIAETLEINNKLPEQFQSADELIQTIKNIYLGKIEKAVNSSKYDKAQTKQAQLKAEETKKILADKSMTIAMLFGV